MRTLLYASLVEEFTGHPRLHGASPAPRIYTASALGQLDIPAQPEKPFVIIREMVSNAYEAVRRTSDAERHNFQVYCFDTRGSYMGIDEILHVARTVVKGLEGVRSSTGAFCFHAEWLGMSQDYHDEQYDAVARFANVQLSSNK